MVPDASGLATDNGDAVGYWSLAGNRIVLTAVRNLDGGNVRHEMLHALLRYGTHPRAQFLGACAGVVDCGERCVADAGAPAPRDPTVPTVTADSLEVAVEVTPSAPSGAQDGGVFTVTVTAHNPSLHPVFVSLVPQGLPRARTFSFDLRGTTGGVSQGMVALDPSVQSFAAGETKRQLFDFVIGSDLISQRPPPGEYKVRGAYAGHWSAYIPIVISP
jgi:hypothetical protein